MMEAAESPLEVLSRAAVMIQRNVLPPPSYDEARSLTQQQNQILQKKCLAMDLTNESNDTAISVSSVYDKSNNSSGKWKRGKKYPHKTTIAASVCDSSLSEYKSSIRLNGKSAENGSEPLDMSKRPNTKDRGEPPSYFQSILGSNYGRRLPDVTGSVYPSSTEPKCTSPVADDDKETMCDQVINEHFRRSLGRDYMNVFSSSRAASKTDNVEEFSQSTLSKTHSEDEVDSSTVTQSASPSALSVDDHFAKALGDTWIKLQQKEKRQNKNQNRKRTNDED